MVFFKNIFGKKQYRYKHLKHTDNTVKIGHQFQLL